MVKITLILPDESLRKITAEFVGGGMNPIGVLLLFQIFKLVLPNPWANTHSNTATNVWNLHYSISNCYNRCYCDSGISDTLQKINTKTNKKSKVGCLTLRVGRVLFDYQVDCW